MVLDVELTHQPGGRYRARVVLWPEVAVEADSRDEALDRIQDAIRARREAGVEIVQVSVDDVAQQALSGEWRRHAGAFPDDDLYQQMLEEVRRQRAADDATDAA
jgi:Asp-tRNA(Asn)/Glu-tRNA(Gln) amidotransferase A subunit family amidase